MASVASQIIEEVTVYAQSDSLEDARVICVDGTYFPNNPLTCILSVEINVTLTRTRTLNQRTQNIRSACSFNTTASKILYRTCCNWGMKAPVLPKRRQRQSVIVRKSQILIWFKLCFRTFRSSWMMDRTRPLEMPTCSGFDWAEIRQSSKISLWIWSIISGVFTVLRRPGLGVPQVQKSPRLNWAIQFLTVTYDDAYSPNVSVRIAWISFSALACRKIKLMTARDSMLLKSRASSDMLPFSHCNKKRLAIRHMSRPLFPKTLSIPSYDIGK